MLPRESVVRLTRRHGAASRASLVIEARDDVEVRMAAGLIIPAQRVAVGSEPLVQLGSYQEQKLACRRPLLGR
jgi:hypothetical protein